MENPLVSIITPNYNSSNFIEATLNSVIAQTYSNWEIIIVDDNSTDNGVEIIKSFQAQFPDKIKFIAFQENKGAALSRNEAIKNAKGRFIAFLDSDDLWYPNKLEKQIQFMLQNSYAFTFTAYDKIDEQGNEIGHIDVPLKINYTDLLKTCSIGCLTAIYDTKILGKVYMPNIRKRQDYALWLKILKKEENAFGINEFLAKYRVRNNSISSNKIKAAQYQFKIYREVEQLSFFQSIFHMITYTVYGVVKTYFK